MKSCHSVVTTMPTTACTTPCRHTSQSRSSWQSMWMVDSTTSPFCQLNDVGRTRNTSFDTRSDFGLIRKCILRSGLGGSLRFLNTA